MFGMCWECGGASCSCKRVLPFVLIICASRQCFVCGWDMPNRIVNILLVCGLCQTGFLSNEPFAEVPAEILTLAKDQRAETIPKHSGCGMCGFQQAQI